MTQKGVKKYKKVSKPKIMNQNTLKKQRNESKFKIMILLCGKIMYTKSGGRKNDTF